MDVIGSQMISVSTLLSSVVALGVVWAYRRWTYRGYALPPGPPQSLISGNFSQFKDNDKMHEIIAGMRKQYGDFITVRFGIYTIVFLNSYKAIKEAYVDKAEFTSDRPDLLFFRAIRGKVGGVFLSNGDTWKQLRRFTISTLRDLGMGKRAVERLIQNEAELITGEFEKYLDTPVNPKRLMANAVGNIISSLIFGGRFDYEDPEYAFFIERLDTFFSQGGVHNMPEAVMPWLMPLMVFRRQGMYKVIRHIKDLKQFILEKIVQHQETYDRDHVRDLIDYYIQAERGELAAKRHQGVWTKDNLLQVIMDLFAAGTETSTTTLNWALLYLVRYPRVQAACRKQISDHLGGRQPALHDLPSLPFIEATILEIQRIANVTPLSFIHATNKDIQLGGHTVPRGVWVWANLYAAAVDPDHWGEDATEFRPERWLDSEGKVIRHESFLPFSVGPRVCLGETLAKSELFLFFTTLVQRLSFTLEDPSQPPTLHGQLGVSYAPKPYKIVVSKV